MDSPGGRHAQGGHRPRHALSDFAKLWLGESISVFGSQVTLLALPLTAVLILGATPQEMGLLTAAQFAAFLLVGLPAGAWVDRLPRRPILIVADIGRTLLLVTVPLAAWSGFLRIEQLYGIAFAAGILTVFFDVAYVSYLPSVVSADRLMEGNSRLEASRSVAQIGGPALAGALVQLVTAPMAMLVDAASFVFSAVCVASIRTPEAEPVRKTEKANLWAEMAEGLRLLLGHPALRTVATAGALINSCGAIIAAIFVLYVASELHIEPAVIGLILAGGGPAALVGAVIASRVSRRVGVGRALLIAASLEGLGVWLMAAAGGPVPVIVGLLFLAEALVGFGDGIWNVNSVSFRQSITPAPLQGRVNGTMRFLMWGARPIAALIAGALGQTIGPRLTLGVGALSITIACCVLLIDGRRDVWRQALRISEWE